MTTLSALKDCDPHRLLLDKGVVGGLARLPSYSELISVARQLSRSRISPAEQVGEHHGGAGGILASIGSSGIAGHATGGGCQLSCFTAQPVASNISTSGISDRSGLFLSRIICPLGWPLSGGVALRFGIRSWW